MDRLPYIKAHTMDELVRAIEEFDGERYAAELEVFMDSMGNYDRGRASEQVVEYVRGHALDF